jgi:hypothetical protein
MLGSVYRTYVRFFGQLYVWKTKRAFGKPNDGYRSSGWAPKVNAGQYPRANAAAAVTAKATPRPKKKARAMSNKAFFFTASRTNRYWGLERELPSGVGV